MRQADGAVKVIVIDIILIRLIAKLRAATQDYHANGNGTHARM